MFVLGNIYIVGSVLNDSLPWGIIFLIGSFFLVACDMKRATPAKILQKLRRAFDLSGLFSPCVVSHTSLSCLLGPQCSCFSLLPQLDVLFTNLRR